MPKATILAIALLVLINTWAYTEEKSGLLYSSIPRKMIKDSIDNLVAKNGIWWIGNSTLAAGIDKEILNQNYDNNAIVELGSATLDTTLRVAEKALSTTSNPPENIILFFNKDDINSGGARAKSSQAYLQAIDDPTFYEIVASSIPAYSTRYAITDLLRNSIASLIKEDKAPSIGKINAPNRNFHSFDDQIDSTYLYNLGQNYRPSKIDLKNIAAKASETGSSIILVSPPVADLVIKWQAKYAGAYTWDVLLSDINSDADQNGIRVLDYSTLLESSTRYFKDAYHLNADGSKKFTRRLISDLSLKHVSENR